MKFRFKPEDFKDVYHRDTITKTANALLEAHEKTLPRVYTECSHNVETCKDADWAMQKCGNTNHTALLWGISELDK